MEFRKLFPTNWEVTELINKKIEFFLNSIFLLETNE